MNSQQSCGTGASPAKKHNQQQYLSVMMRFKAEGWSDEKLTHELKEIAKTRQPQPERSRSIARRTKMPVEDFDDHAPVQRIVKFSMVEALSRGIARQAGIEIKQKGRLPGSAPEK